MLCAIITTEKPILIFYSEKSYFYDVPRLVKPLRGLGFRNFDIYSTNFATVIPSTDNDIFPNREQEFSNYKIFLTGRGGVFFNYWVRYLPIIHPISNKALKSS